MIVLLIIFGVPIAAGVISGILSDMWDKPSKEQRDINNQLWNGRLSAGFLNSAQGVRIVSIYSQGSFGVAGIEKNDYIKKVNGQDILSAQEVAQMFPVYHDVITVEIERKGEIIEYDVYIKDFVNRNFTDVVGAEAIKQLTTFKNSEYVLAYDTNILLKYPFLFSTYTKSNHILLAKQVFKELDKQKADEKIGHQARKAISLIEQAQKEGANLNFSSASDSYTESKNLDPSSPDDRIIASYIYEAEKNDKKIIFISEDRGARIIAREAGLETIDWPA